MKTPRITMLIGMAAVTVSSILAADDRAIEKEMAQLQGEWSIVSGSVDGQAMTEQMLKQMKRVCKGDESTTTMAGQVFMKAKITIDPSKRPKTIDYERTDDFAKGKQQLGIYELQGDTFKSCVSKPGAGRPTDFSSKPGDGQTLSVWRREKQATAAPEQK